MQLATDSANQLSQAPLVSSVDVLIPLLDDKFAGLPLGSNLGRQGIVQEGMVV